MPIIEGEANIVNKLFNSLEGHKTLANIPVLTFHPLPRPFCNPLSTLHLRPQSRTSWRRNRIKTDLLLQISRDSCSTRSQGLPVSCSLSLIFSLFLSPSMETRNRNQTKSLQLSVPTVFIIIKAHLIRI